MKPITLTIIMVLIITACGKKRAEKINELRRDVASLHTEWESTQQKIAEDMKNMKTDLKDFGQVQTDLKELIKTRNTKTQREANQLLETTNQNLSLLKVQADSLNIYTKEWSLKSKSFNELMDLIESNGIDPEDATERVAELRVFRSKADSTFNQFGIKLKDFTVKKGELQKHLNRLKKIR